MATECAKRVSGEFEQLVYIQKTVVLVSVFYIIFCYIDAERHIIFAKQWQSVSVVVFVAVIKGKAN